MLYPLLCNTSMIKVMCFILFVPRILEHERFLDALQIYKLAVFLFEAGSAKITKNLS